jgi:hypothetical protein
VLPALRKTFRITLGVTLVVLGLIGGLIPVVQGWMFGIPGLLILSEYFPPVKRLVEWAKAKASRGSKKSAQGDAGDGGASIR